MDDDGYEEVVIPCAACWGAGQVITLEDPPQLGTCARCGGKGRLVLVCAAEDAADISEKAADAMTRARVKAQTAAALDGAGICLWCLGAGRLCSIERDESDRPVRYAEAGCPACTGALETQ